MPRGSVLGPLLFLIYINSVFKLNLKGKIIAFADDMALSYSGSSSLEVAHNINSDLKILHIWFDNHFMILSEKTKIMYFKLAGDPYFGRVPDIVYHDRSCNNVDCNDNCINIEYVYQFKYLGVQLDANLNWKSHYQSLKQQLNFTLRAICICCVHYVLPMFYLTFIMRVLALDLAMVYPVGVEYI